MASLFLDKTTTGDGSEKGTCPATPSNLKCQPNGACLICNHISNNYVGCDITSVNPVCDSDAATTGLQDYFDNPATTREWVACKKDGKMG